MNDILSTIMNTFATMQPREKLFLKAGGGLILAVLLVLLLLPSIEKYQQLNDQRNSLEADMAWLVEQRDLVAGLSNGCPKMNQSNEDQKANLSNIAKRNQLKVESITDNEQSFLLSVSADEGNKFLKSIYQIACQGYNFVGINLNPEDEKLSLLKATFEVQRVK
jgi:type II secretory pathway component PulM